MVPHLAETAPAQRVAFTLESRPGMFRIEAGSLVDSAGEPFANVADMPVSAPHDRANALAAAAAAFAAGATRDRVERALREYPRLHHRVARIGNTGGVQYYNDSKATNPHATLSAVAAFDELDGKVVLIAGGRNKGLDLSVLRPLAPRLRAVVAMGEAATEVERTFADAVPVAEVDRRQQLGGKRQPRRPHIGGHQRLEPRLVDRHLAAPQPRNLCRIGVDTSHRHAEFGKTRPRNQAHIPRPDHCNAHRLDFPLRVKTAAGRGLL